MSSDLSKPRHFDPAFVFPPDTPVIVLDAKDAFEKLTEKEKLYSHFLARASFFGGLIVLVQTSPESPQVFVFTFCYVMVKQRCITGGSNDGKGPVEKVVISIF
jgi:hypothetical protein